MKVAKEGTAHDPGDSREQVLFLTQPCWLEAVIHGQGVKFDAAVIRSRTRILRDWPRGDQLRRSAGKPALHGQKRYASFFEVSSS